MNLRSTIPICQFQFSVSICCAINYIRCNLRGKLGVGYIEPFCTTFATFCDSVSIYIKF